MIAKENLECLDRSEHQRPKFLDAWRPSTLWDWSAPLRLVV